MTLAETLDAAAAELDRVDRRTEGAATVWSAGGQAFAALTGRTAEFRLQPAVARAALGTPDTAISRRGRDWVAFTPVELDQFASDRATAWLGSAHRNAVVGGAKARSR